MGKYQEKQYRSTRLDYVLKRGGSYVISNQLEVFALYSKGLVKCMQQQIWTRHLLSPTSTEDPSAICINVWNHFGKYC
ncbi:hypothetical protein [Chryseobacterium sp.]|uniref:hypothetical protein n=1 Tax=Chryseobacterium sp. TaxID=1871047 RepID=UPI00261BA35D|nr:hypothetical protein [Chryseobacterium sp.]